jgi:hypothetical protein
MSDICVPIMHWCLVVEFTIKRTAATPQRPHGVSYALVLRLKTGGAPWVRFDNAHAVTQS